VRIGRELGLGGADRGCQASNPTCNSATVAAGNLINSALPQLVKPRAGDWRPVSGGAVFSTPTITIPPFSWADAPPGVPPGLSDNAVETDRNGSTRNGTPVAGAHAVGG
jgi:hypothetical protein